MSATSYRATLRSPGVSFLLATSLVARLPVAMVNLAIILRVAGATGSYARAGVVTGTYVVATGIFGPLLGRMADRLGRRPVLLATALVNAAGLVSLALVPVKATAVLLVIAAISGASQPPVAPAVRSLWVTLGGEDLTSSLYALDATLQETTFMVGPALVALLSSVYDPATALIACGAIGVAGTVAVTSHPAVSVNPSNAEGARRASASPGTVAQQGAAEQRPTGDGPPSHGLEHELERHRRPHRPGLVQLVAMVVVFLTAILCVEVTVVAFAGHHHATDQSGLLLATWASGSMVGGLLFGARAARGGPRAVGRLMLGVAVGFSLLALAPAPGVLYGLLFLAGMSIAPAFSCVYSLVGDVAPEGSSVEAFSWVASGIQLGAAAGAALGGLMVDDAGTHLTFVIAAGLAVTAAGVASWRPMRRVVGPQL